MYLVAVIDWFSRYVLAWEILNTLDTDFCLIALERALKQGTPQIFNTDQGAQFISDVFTERLYGCPQGAVKYEEVYPNDYSSLVFGRQRLNYRPLH